MASVQYLIIFNISILLIASSAGNVISKQRVIRSGADYYSDETSSHGSDEDQLDDECTEITHNFLCRDDGVSIVMSHGESKGNFYVDGYQNDEKCAKKFHSHKSTLNILFGHCGLEKSSEVKFNVTMQVTDGQLMEEPETIPINCSYRSHSSNVSDGVPPMQPRLRSEQVNITGPPEPNYHMTISDVPKKNIMRAVINITSKVKDARAKNCYAVAKNDTNNKLQLTNNDGCSVTDRFSEWEFNSDANTLVATFKPFNLVGASGIDIICTVESCHSESECRADCPQADSKRRKCGEKHH